MVIIAYGTSAYVNSFTGSAYGSTEVTAAIALADDLCEAYALTTWSGTIPTPVIIASSLIAKNILQSGMLHNIQKDNMEPTAMIDQFITPEIAQMLNSQIDTDTYGHASEDFA